MHIDIDTVLPAHPSDVWRYLRDISRHVEWMHDADSITFLSDQREGVGTTFDCLTKVGPLRTSDRMEITEWVDEQVMGVRHTGIVTGEGRFTLEPHDAGTRFRWDETLHLPIWFGGRLGEIAAKPILEFIWRRNLKGLRDNVIAELGSVTPIHERVPGALIGTGRDCDVREFGSDAVARISRRGRSLADEAAVMQHVHAAGYPTAELLHVVDDETIVMERLDGPTMLDDLTAHPWRLRKHARTLARLHHDLSKIDALPSMKRVGPGNKVVHLDLHPDNVKMTEDGPRVFDWANAASGSVEIDAAMTYVLLRTAHADVPLVARAAVAAFRKRFAAAFLAAAGRDAVLAQVTAAAELRLLDPNLLAAERDAVFALARGELDD